MAGVGLLAPGPSASRWRGGLQAQLEVGRGRKLKADAADGQVAEALDQPRRRSVWRWTELLWFCLWLRA